VSYPDYVTVSSNENILKYRKIIIQVSQFLFAGYFGEQLYNKHTVFPQPASQTNSPETID
jgi:hypothetical protein